MSEHEQWVERAISLSKQGKDTCLQVGCVIVSPVGEILSEGWNRVPDRIKDEDVRYQKPAKYFWTEHAERFAVYDAARRGVCLEGSTVYLNYSPVCICVHCVRALIQAGVIRFIGPEREFNCKGRTTATDIVNRRMIEEAGIEVIVV